MSDDGLQDRHRTAIVRVLAANGNVERAVLFGSRSTRTFAVTSDIDLALFGEQLTATDQARLTAEMEALPMAQRVDLLLYATVTDDALRQHIREDGIEWYRRGRDA